MSSAPGKVSTTDIATLYVTGNNFSINGRDQDDHRDHTKGVVSYYKPDLLGGNHEFKARGRPPLYARSMMAMGPSARTTSSATSSGSTTACPSSSTRRNTPAKGLNYSNYFGVYGQDSWTLARRVTLNLGLRFEHDVGVCAGAMPRGRGLCGGPVLRRVPAEDLQLARAARAHRVRRDGRRQDRDQGWVWALQSAARAAAGSHQHQSQRPRDDDLGLAR